MRRNTLFLAAGLLLLAAASALFLLTRRGESGELVARISLDGAVVEEIDLSALTQPKTLTVTGKSGLQNTIVAEPGRIYVREADCPDQICVHQGAITDGTVPIVCLPNHLIIELIGGGGSGLDAATN